MSNSEFLLSLDRDLRQLGITLDSYLETQKEPANTASRYSVHDESIKQFRLNRIRENRQLICRLEKRQISDLFCNGRDLDPNHTKLEIHICTSRSDHEIFRYCQLMQGIGAGDRIGRQIRCLLFDRGQKQLFLFGALSLASSPYTVGARDNYFDWKGLNRKHMKDIGLKKIMEVAMVMPIPPFSYILGGKLLAALALSREIRDHYANKYGDVLVAVTTTCVTGLHCPIFNRIMIKPGGLYRRIGQTSGYSTMLVSANTMRMARALLSGYKSAPQGEFSISVRPISILRQALNRSGIRPELVIRSAPPRGVYAGLLSDNGLLALRTGEPYEESIEFRLIELEEYWKRDLVPKAQRSKSRRMKFLKFKKEENLLSRYLS